MEFEWDRVKKNMNKKIKYSKAPKDIGLAIVNATTIEDFLPSPEQLGYDEKLVKVTISLSKKSVDFFKSQAKTSHASYQKMVRRVIDGYVEHYSK